MNQLGLVLGATALAALGAGAAQATNFDVEVIYWQGSDAPPVNPGANQVAHFQIDDAGAKTVYTDSATFLTSGTGFNGYSGDLRVDFYDADAGGGIGVIPFLNGQPDYNNMASGGSLSVATAPVLYTGSLDTAQLKTGTFDMIDVFQYPPNYQLLADSHYRVIISEAELGVPEPASWAMMLAGFGLVGGTLRRRRVAFA